MPDQNSSSLPTLLLLLPLFSAVAILLGNKVLKGACVALSVSEFDTIAAAVFGSWEVPFGD
jgi:hypothetical protein